MRDVRPVEQTAATSKKKANEGEEKQAESSQVELDGLKQLLLANHANLFCKYRESEGLHEGCKKDATGAKPEIDYRLRTIGVGSRLENQLVGRDNLLGRSPKN